MDNNETYSALLHAHNLWNFDFFRSFGLADDVASPAQAAHPVIHTHQGDFPRLFSFILYAFGARNAESHIWITTFTIGVASVLLAKCFFHRLAGELFATIATLMLITDYLLFAQWQVNTYRIWHGFFLFGSLVCVHGLSDWKRSYWAVTTIFLYMFLLYWELVFASFVAITAGAYTAWTYRRTPRLIFAAGLTQTLGATLGLGVLIVQVIFFLGWHDFLTDINLTYDARNIGADPATIFHRLNDFYETRNITFWYNIQSHAEFVGATTFLRSTFTNVLQVHTPFFVLMTLSLAAAGLFADSRLPCAIDTKVANPRIAEAAVLILIPGLYGFLMMVMYGDGVLGVIPTTTIANVGLSVAANILLLLLATAVSAALRSLATAISVNGTAPSFQRCLVASIYFFLLGIFIITQGFLYDQEYRGLWFDLLTPAPAWIAKLVICAIALAGGLLILVGRRSILGQWQNVPASLMPFFGSGILGYLFVYKFSAGYLHSGYLYRLCPFSVFHIDTLLALGPFTAIAMSTAFLQRTRNSWSKITMSAMAILSGALGIALFSYWGTLQFRYMNLMPPDRFSFTQLLKSLPFPNEGIISNTYAAPFGFIANTWAYIDPDFGNLTLDSLDKGPAKYEYMWFADRRINQAYRRPEIFICFAQLGFYNRLIDPASPLLYRVSHCSDMPIVARSRKQEEENSIPQLELIQRDEKYDLWAIYRIQWKSASVQRTN